MQFVIVVVIGLVVFLAVVRAVYRFFFVKRDAPRCGGCTGCGVHSCTPSTALPEGTTNCVTRAGMDELLAEREELVNEKENLNKADENEKRMALNHINYIVFGKCIDE